MANDRYTVEYATSALDDLRSLPKREAGQIIRKVLRLEHGLHGNIKRFKMPMPLFGCAWAIIGFYLM